MGDGTMDSEHPETVKCMEVAMAKGSRDNVKMFLEMNNLAEMIMDKLVNEFKSNLWILFMNIFKILTI